MAYAERPSQHLGFRDFLKEKLIRILIGSGAGAFVGSQSAKFWGFSAASRQWMSIVGAAIGSQIAGFRNWRRNETRHLSVDQVYDDYRHLPGLRRSNEEITSDNALLKQMIAFEQEKALPAPAKHITAATTHHDGRIETPTHERVV